jgi:hypothetical protein
VKGYSVIEVPGDDKGQASTRLSAAPCARA